MSKVLDEMDGFYTEIRDARVKLADLVKEKVNLKTEAWKDANSIKLAKEKEDYVRSQISDVQNEIDKLEADIEYYYNQVKLLGHKLEFGDD